jgi:hypothetical protein
MVVHNDFVIQGTSGLLLHYSTPLPEKDGFLGAVRATINRFNHYYVPCDLLVLCILCSKKVDTKESVERSVVFSMMFIFCEHYC